ncbi:TBC1 domain family member 13-like [Rhodamnia argentea]|uniref:TBC1 domain family member 13-like n=1 Tax=Rhodamnia argentea TaxID=178133 RepID=A0A8B8MKJ7_9MYRT|nr:TBC1 domain family member 13-like [Rhodamnia argentea]
MLKSKLKIPDKTRKPFPDRLGSLVAGFDSRDGENGGSGAALEFGEELETIQPNGFGSDREFEEPDDGVEEECAQDEDAAGGAGGGEPDLRARQRPNTREGSGPVSVLEVIAADEKRSDVEHEISQEEINLEKLQRIATMGLPDEGGLRATSWKLLLGYLPPSRKLWEKELSENRLKYAKLKEDLLISPSEFARRKNLNSGPCETEAGSDVDGPLRRHQIAQEDHPLSLGKASVWNQYFENTEVAEQIDRDLQRTHPDMKFFSGETVISRRHREAMRNILLLFAKLNPAIRYVQGMNEVLAPIYYVFSTDPNEQNAANAEADSFSCFVRLLGDSVDHFCQQLDNSSVGILSTISRLSELLKTNDEELWRHLEFTTRVEPQFYAFRWITLLLTQEFSFQSILRIWDSLLGNPFGVQDMLLRVCCAMLLCVKSKLLRGDFIANLKLLQHYPDINIEHLLQVAMDLTPDTSSYRLSL